NAFTDQLSPRAGEGAVPRGCAVGLEHGPATGRARADGMPYRPRTRAFPPRSVPAPSPACGGGRGWGWPAPPPRPAARHAGAHRSGEGWMLPGWVLLLVSVGYAALLFAVAWIGDRYPLYPQRPWLRPLVYSLALAVYCSSWTFYGAVGTAVRSGIGYVPIYLGPLLL